jgi:hypothetical protein
MELPENSSILLMARMASGSGIDHRNRKDDDQEGRPKRIAMRMARQNRWCAG